MTVGELINKLQQYDENMMVVIDGYEGGVDELLMVAEEEIILDYNAKAAWYYGRHERCAWFPEEEKSKLPRTKVLYLPR